jgi:hypothetical protein
MRRWLVLLPAAAGFAVVVAAGAAAFGGSDSRDRGGYVLYGRNYFAVACDFSHRNDDDPIVFPNGPGRSHNHTFFGNTTTNAFSTPGRLRASGSTTCSARADTAAYWVPTLLIDGQAVEPRGATVYYIRRTIGRVQPFPADLEVIAGDAAARSAQSLRVTSWDCGAYGRTEPTSEIPTCSGGRRSSLRLVVNFPNCWDGSQLDSANHRSHLAYSVDGVCPESHPVAVPAISLRVRYGVSGGPTAELPSVGDFSGHADFVNAWDQRTLSRLVDRFLNRGRGRR